MNVTISPAIVSKAKSVPVLIMAFVIVANVNVKKAGPGQIVPAANPTQPVLILKILTKFVEVMAIVSADNVSVMLLMRLLTLVNSVINVQLVKIFVMFIKIVYSVLFTTVVHSLNKIAVIVPSIRLQLQNFKYYQAKNFVLHGTRMIVSFISNISSRKKKMPSLLRHRILKIVHSQLIFLLL